MIVQLHRTATAFLGRAGIWLGRSEVENSLILGLATRRADREHRGDVKVPEPPWLFATVHEHQDGPPSAAAMMTPGYPMLLAGDQEFPNACSALVPWLVLNRWKLPGILGHEDLARRFADHWCQETGQLPSLVRRERIHEARQGEILVPAGIRGHLRRAAADAAAGDQEGDREVIARWMHQFHHEAVPEDPLPDVEHLVERHLREGSIFLWDIGRPVSMVVHARSTRSTASISGVFTPPQERGNGYASACVATLCERLLRKGFASCVLYADLANPTSNQIYRRIGFSPVCAVRHISFASEQT